MQNKYMAIDNMKALENNIYGEYLILLENVIEEILLRIEMIRRLSILHGIKDPIDHCKARIKSPKSMEKKLKRKNLPITTEAALNEIHDAAGIRIVCTFVDDVYSVVEMLRKQEDFQVIKEKDYIQYPKGNGYRSYHMIIKVPVHLAEKVKNMYVEIQIRTIAMDCWASLEHQLKYKHEIKNQEMIVNELKRCADEIASTDLTLQTIREMINESL